MATIRGLNFPTGAERTPLFSSVAHSTPARCVQLSHNPSVHVYHALKLKIEHSSALWLREFLELDGLGSLMEALQQLSNATFTGFSDAILQLDCVACVRSVLNTNSGITYFINSDDYTRKLITGLASPSILSKKHVFELMTAVCVYSAKGYGRIMEALDHYQRKTDQTSRFSVIISELKTADTAIYRTALMSLVNSIINCTEDIHTRNSVRNEFIAYQLLDIVNHFRRDEKDADLAVQLEAFSVAKHKDDQTLAENYKLNANNHQELFAAIFQSVLGMPESSVLLGILQDLHLMTITKHSSLWSAVGQAVHHAASLANKSEAESFIRNLSSLSRPCPPSNHSGGGTGPAQLPPLHDGGSGQDADVLFKEGIMAGSPGMCRLNRKDSGISVGSVRSNNSSVYDNGRSSQFVRQGSGRDSGHRSLRGSGRMARIAENETKGMGRMPTRQPRRPVKNVRWVKVPNSKIKSEISLWAQGTDYRLTPDYSGLETEFAAPQAERDGDDEVELLPGEQSVALNVYLSRMDMTPEELVGYLEDADDVRVGLSGLRYLMAVLPSHEEVMQLRNFKGERYDLGQAEQFLLMLSDLPDYRTLLSCLLFKAEFGPRYQKLKAAFSAMIRASRDILHHQGLKEFLFLILDSGNFLNSGSPFANAGGVKLSSLSRLTEVKGQHGGQHLLDHLVRVAESQSEDVIMFATDMPHLTKAASHDLEELKTEVTQLSTEMRKVLTQLSSTHDDVKGTFEFFVEDVKQDLQQLQDSITHLRSLSHQVAFYFSEDDTNFRLHTALKLVNDFCEAVKKCTKEGLKLRQQKAMADSRRKELTQKCAESHMARVFGKQADACSSFLIPQAEKVVDSLLNEVHSGNIEVALGDDLATPDLEWDPLHVSRIVPASPIEEEFTDIHMPEDLGRKCLPERVEPVLAVQYRKGNQIMSGSFLNPENSGKKWARGEEVRGPLASPEVFSVKGSQPQLDLVRSAHRRTASDPNTAQSPTQKWANYEKQKTDKKKKCVPESSLGIASLGLEQDGRALSREDVLTEAPLATDEENDVKEKKKKKSSFGLLKKLSRALRPKMSENPQKQVQPRQRKKAQRPSKLDLGRNKENADPVRELQAENCCINQNQTTLEEAKEEQMYKIVFYQKYTNSEC